MDLPRTTEVANRLCSAKGWGSPKFIDAGASAAVFRVDRGPQGLAALKIYDPAFFEGGNALIEKNRCILQKGLKGHRHPNLVDIIDVDEIPGDGTWYLLMEFCPWPSMEKRLAEIPDDSVHHLLKQLTEAVLFLEENGYIHRDIKPANIVISNDFLTLKLLDLGVLRKINPDEGSGTDGDEQRRFIATAQYAPPEFLTRDELPGAAGFAAINIYQVGAVLHDMIMKEPLFESEAATKNKYIVYKAVVGKTPRVASAAMPLRLISLCRCALEKDPQKRIERVSLRDFLADADEHDTLRRRVVGARQRSAMPIPSLQEWQRVVRDWVGKAARLEREALGATTIRASTADGTTRWTIQFSNVESPVHVDFRRSGKALFVDVVSETEPRLATTVVEIGPEGPDCVTDEIPTLLASQLLYALDLAQTTNNSLHGAAK